MCVFNGDLFCLDGYVFQPMGAKSKKKKRKNKMRGEKKRVKAKLHAALQDVFNAGIDKVLFGRHIKVEKGTELLTHY